MWFFPGRVGSWHAKLTQKKWSLWNRLDCRPSCKFNSASHHLIDSKHAWLMNEYPHGDSHCIHARMNGSFLMLVITFNRFSRRMFWLHYHHHNRSASKRKVSPADRGLSHQVTRRYIKNEWHKLDNEWTYVDERGKERRNSQHAKFSINVQFESRLLPFLEKYLTFGRREPHALSEWLRSEAI